MIFATIAVLITNLIGSYYLINTFDHVYYVFIYKQWFPVLEQVLIMSYAKKVEHQTTKFQ